MTLVDGPNAAVPVSGTGASEASMTDKLPASHWALAWLIAATDTRLAMIISTPIRAEQTFNRDCPVIAASMIVEPGSE